MEITSSPERSIPLIGDCIGCESCVEVMPLIGGWTHSSNKVQNAQTATKMRRMAKTEPPPPIPLLARTGNLHARMPWILRRHYTPDGRLILREERVRHHEYFRAHRSGGRLTLQLVPLEDRGFDLPIVDPDDDEIACSPRNNSCLHSKVEDICHIEEEEEEIACSPRKKNPSLKVDICHNSCLNSKEEDICHIEEEKEREKDDDSKEQYSLASATGKATAAPENGAVIGGSSEWKCLYKTVSPSSSFMFGMPAVHSLGPVLG